MCKIATVINIFIFLCMIKKYVLTLLAVIAQFLLIEPVFAVKTNTGDLVNLVCFVRFADEADNEVFSNNYSVYEQMFNNESEGANSVFNYFKHSSYGQLRWRSVFFPAPQGEKVVSLQTQYERGFYMKYSSISAPSGYKTDIEKAARLQALSKEIAGYLNTHFPADKQLDGDDDGFIDNLCVIFSKESGRKASEDLLWSENMNIFPPAEIKGKKVANFSMVFDEANGFKFTKNGYEPIPLNTGVICHEMSHTLGTYDLYHVSDNLNPVGVWDLMSDLQPVPQQMLVYTKMKYAKWIDAIPEISTPGTYTLNPVGGTSKENIAYKIKPIGKDEYFVLEYRKKEGYDASIPESGLLIYRINPNVSGGNVNYDGKKRLDETYIFRPGGSTKDDGNILQAAFSAESGRITFGGTATEKPFYSDGTPADFVITNISTCGETLSFTLEASKKKIIVSPLSLVINGAVNSAGNVKVSSDVDWKLSNMPEWLAASITEGTAGTTNVMFTAQSSNPEIKNRTAQILFSAKDGSDVKATLEVAQASSVVSAPEGLTAVTNKNEIALSWYPVVTGDRILGEDFENKTNPNHWTVANTTDRGWRWELAGRFYKAYEGSYAATVYYGSLDHPTRMDESLISPTFAYGKILAFQSRTTASETVVPASDPDYYQVEVSDDDGATWTVLADMRTATSKKVRNKYTKVILDLSSRQSDKMKIRFHAFDTGSEGLTHYWQVDNVEVYDGSSTITITGYKIYRNGALLGTSQTLNFTDANPISGNNEYRISVVGSFGESSLSAPVTVNFATTGIDTAPRIDAVSTTVYTLSGMQVGRSLEGLAKGIYIVKSSDGKGKVTVRKVLVR